MTDRTTMLGQMLQTQLMWQQLLWRMPIALCGGRWMAAPSDKQAHAEIVDCAAHAQLAVPVDDGDHALFA